MFSIMVSHGEKYMREYHEELYTQPMFVSVPPFDLICRLGFRRLYNVLPDATLVKGQDFEALVSDIETKCS